MPPRPPAQSPYSADPALVPLALVTLTTTICAWAATYGQWIVGPAQTALNILVVLSITGVVALPFVLFRLYEEPRQAKYPMTALAVWTMVMFTGLLAFEKTEGSRAPALERVVLHAAPILEAIHNYEDKFGAPPAALGDLPARPDLCIFGSCSRFEYHTNNEHWSLAYRWDDGYAASDGLLYLSNPDARERRGCVDWNQQWIWCD